MKILIDMNLPPSWVEVFRRYGYQSMHWKDVGDVRATDAEIMEWAVNNKWLIFTNDLDFSSILAHTKSTSPSVIQVRAQDVLPLHLEKVIINALKEFSIQLESGALISIDEISSQVRILPLKK